MYMKEKLFYTIVNVQNSFHPLQCRHHNDDAWILEQIGQVCHEHVSCFLATRSMLKVYRIPWTLCNPTGINPWRLGRSIVMSMRLIHSRLFRDSEPIHPTPATSSSEMILLPAFQYAKNIILWWSQSRFRTQLPI
ncbi:hypothetical protein AVEN_108371-1 [Araneus ventricosus]|uniref:Uncharacterized protein n=1 Tax=Araneus ventricosus TaxID=182803 RepID=A0A4Y2CXC0_ARAVE|nr:hypothetical protein AVEN_108371-1 [Araneus ventricosus]